MHPSGRWVAKPTRGTNTRHRRDRLRRRAARAGAARRRTPRALPRPQPGQARRAPGATTWRSCRATSPSRLARAPPSTASRLPTTWCTRWAGPGVRRGRPRGRHLLPGRGGRTAASADLVYLGGLGDDDDPGLSRHLRSRHEVGRVLADGPVPVTELRAAVIIGSGQRLVRDAAPPRRGAARHGDAPRGCGTRCQPDRHPRRAALARRRASITPPRATGCSRSAGPRSSPTADMMRLYAEVAGLPRRLVVPVPVLSPRLSSLWVGLVTPLPASLARPLVEGLGNEVVVRDRPVSAALPHEPIPVRQAVVEALRRVERPRRGHVVAAPPRAGRHAGRSRPDRPGLGGRHAARRREAGRDHRGAGSGVRRRHRDRRRSRLVRPPIGSGRCAACSTSWSAGSACAAGGATPTSSRVGDALDFWRVEAFEPDRLLRLRAEMRLPGQAWLEWRDRATRRRRRRSVQRASSTTRGASGAARTGTPCSRSTP